MTIKTPLKRWIRAILLDTTFGGTFFYVAYFGPEWFETLLAAFFALLFLASIVFFGFVAFMTCIARTPTEDKELDKKVALQAATLWNDKMVDIFSRSVAFTHYHIATSVLFMIMFINTGHYFIPILQLMGMLISLYLIGTANEIRILVKHNTIKREL